MFSSFFLFLFFFSKFRFVAGQERAQGLNDYNTWYADRNFTGEVIVLNDSLHRDTKSTIYSQMRALDDAKITKFLSVYLDVKEEPDWWLR